jgi:hypothetical protein
MYPLRLFPNQVHLPTTPMLKANICAKPESYVQTYHVQICIMINDEKEIVEKKNNKGSSYHVF